MTKARDIADGTGGIDTTGFLTSSDLTGYLTDQSTLNPAKLDTNVSLPALDGSSLTGIAAGGKLAQLKQKVYTTQVSVSQASFITLGSNGDNLEVEITPTANDSEIYINYTIQANHASNRGYRSRIVRTVNGSDTTVLEMNNQKDTYGNGNTNQSRSSVQYLDSPATTNTITYKIQVATDGAQGVDFAEGSSPCMITVMEIKA